MSTRYLSCFRDIYHSRKVTNVIVWVRYAYYFDLLTNTNGELFNSYGLIYLCSKLSMNSFMTLTRKQSPCSPILLHESSLCQALRPDGQLEVVNNIFCSAAEEEVI